MASTALFFCLKRGGGIRVLVTSRMVSGYTLAGRQGVLTFVETMRVLMRCEQEVSILTARRVGRTHCVCGEDSIDGRRRAV